MDDSRGHEVLGFIVGTFREDPNGARILSLCITMVINRRSEFNLFICLKRRSILFLSLSGILKGLKIDYIFSSMMHLFII